MTLLRPLSVLALLALLVVAVVGQTAFFPYLAWGGVVPNLVLLVVVAAGLARGPETAVVLGFVGGLMLDLAPPADGLAGRWALALVVVGYLAGKVRPGVLRSIPATLATVAAGSFVGTSLFALSGLVAVDGVSVGEALRVIPLSLAYDLLLAPFVLPLTLRVMRRVQSPQVAY